MKEPLLEAAAAWFRVVAQCGTTLPGRFVSLHTTGLAVQCLMPLYPLTIEPAAMVSLHAVAIPDKHIAMTAVRVVPHRTNATRVEWLPDMSWDDLAVPGETMQPALVYGRSPQGELQAWASNPLAQALSYLGEPTDPLTPLRPLIGWLAEQFIVWEPGRTVVHQAATYPRQLVSVSHVIQPGGRRALALTVHRPAPAAAVVTLTDFVRYAWPGERVSSQEDRDWLLLDWVADMLPTQRSE